MRRIIAALALVGLTATSAYAGAIVVYDVDLGEEFAAKREIVAVAKDVYGETAVYDTGERLGRRGGLDVFRQARARDQSVLDALGQRAAGVVDGRLPVDVLRDGHDLALGGELFAEVHVVDHDRASVGGGGGQPDE